MILRTKIKTVSLMRTKETMKKYFDYLAEIAKKELNNDKEEDPFKDIEKRAIKKFKYWILVKNNFPYDAIAEISHLLFTRRKVPFDWELLTTEERNELIELKKTYLKENYDTIIENLPSIQTVPGHFHLQLLKLKRIPVEEFFSEKE